MMVRWLIGVLAAWRVTHLLNSEDGPGEIIHRSRLHAGEGFLGQLLNCFYCLSLWTALPFALLGSRSWRERFFLWPAISAGAILIELALRQSEPSPAMYFEDEEP